MPNGHGLRPEVETGEACARCFVLFDGAHGQPVLCHQCHGPGKTASGTPAMPGFPKAWLEEKA